ncbi:MAG: SBBP repeat-containing protein [Candidatus Zixiibacteriota bacterium]|nr:MAG: SBBP repeat-containing protein [candidate division Zixibacteria bacterium]
MKRAVITGKSLVLLIVFGVLLPAPAFCGEADYGSSPIVFTENQGQWDEMVLFRASVRGATVWYTSDGVSYQFTREARSGDGEGPNQIESMMIKASFVDANCAPRVIGESVPGSWSNYFIGDDPGRWCAGIPNFSSIRYEDIYPGIDLRYYGKDGAVEYDFIIAPGADLSRIRIRYEGVRSVSISDDGELLVATKWGKLVERRPVVYQTLNNSRVIVDGRYELFSDNTFSFSITGDYDPSEPLVIDPVVLAYSTYLGGSDDDYGQGIAVDGSGAIYVAGRTASTDFPTVDPYQTDQTWTDVFVAKLSSDGSSLIYSTYLGGNANDLGYGLAIDATGAAYVTGYTYSTDFPTLNAYQASHGGGASDVFVTKLDNTGGALSYSTYLGGTGSDQGQAIAVDASGAAYLTGRTLSADFPTLNPYQGTISAIWDVFVTKLSSAGNSLAYSTYLGGNSNERGAGIAVNDIGAAYIAGYTESTDFPTVSAYQGSMAGAWDGFITKLAIAGNDLTYSTYLGGSSGDENSAIALDASGSAYVTGWTASADFPTVNPYQASLAGETDVHVTRMNTAGSGPVYATYLGGAGQDQARGIAVNTSGEACVTGNTSSVDFPTVNAYQTNQALGDIFVTRLDGSGDVLVFSTYVGGSGDESSAAVAVDGSGSAYVTGQTNSSDFPTEAPYQSASGGGCDVVILKLDVETGGITPVEYGLPTEYSLCQNYPNPFNPTTEISFSLPRASHVKLEIVNLMGRKVSTLIDGPIKAGYHTVSFDGSKLASGVYLYRLTAGEFEQARKMMLVK